MDNNNNNILECVAWGWCESNQRLKKVTGMTLCIWRVKKCFLLLLK